MGNSAANGEIGVQQQNGLQIMPQNENQQELSRSSSIISVMKSEDQFGRVLLIQANPTSDNKMNVNSQTETSIVFEKTFVDAEQLRCALAQVRLFKIISTHQNIITIQSIQSSLGNTNSIHKGFSKFVGRVNCEYCPKNVLSLIKEKTFVNSQQSSSSSFMNQHKTSLFFFKEPGLKRTFESILEGLCQCMINKIIHGDIRAQTVYFNSFNVAKISIVQCFPLDHSHTSFAMVSNSIAKGKQLDKFIIQQNILLSPEQIILLNKFLQIEGRISSSQLQKFVSTSISSYNQYKSDVFSLGILMLQMMFCSTTQLLTTYNSQVNQNYNTSPLLSGLYIYYESTKSLEINLLLINSLLSQCNDYSWNFVKLLKRCLEQNPNNRPDCMQLKKEINIFDFPSEPSVIAEEEIVVNIPKLSNYINSDTFSKSGTQFHSRTNNSWSVQKSIPYNFPPTRTYSSEKCNQENGKFSPFTLVTDNKDKCQQGVSLQLSKQYQENKYQFSKGTSALSTPTYPNFSSSQNSFQNLTPSSNIQNSSFLLNQNQSSSNYQAPQLQQSTHQPLQMESFSQAQLHQQLSSYPLQCQNSASSLNITEQKSKIDQSNETIKVSDIFTQNKQMTNLKNTSIKNTSGIESTPNSTFNTSMKNFMQGNTKGDDNNKIESSCKPKQSQLQRILMKNDIFSNTNPLSKRNGFQQVFSPSQEQQKSISTLRKPPLTSGISPFNCSQAQITTSSNLKVCEQTALFSKTIQDNKKNLSTILNGSYKMQSQKASNHITIEQFEPVEIKKMQFQNVVPYSSSNADYNLIKPRQQTPINNIPKLPINSNLNRATNFFSAPSLNSNESEIFSASKYMNQKTESSNTKDKSIEKMQKEFNLLNPPFVNLTSSNLNNQKKDIQTPLKSLLKISEKFQGNKIDKMIDQQIEKNENPSKYKKDQRSGLSLHLNLDYSKDGDFNNSNAIEEQEELNHCYGSPKKIIVSSVAITPKVIQCESNSHINGVNQIPLTLSPQRVIRTKQSTSKSPTRKFCSEKVANNTNMNELRTADKVFLSSIVSPSNKQRQQENPINEEIVSSNQQIKIEQWKDLTDSTMTSNFPNEQKKKEEVLPLSFQPFSYQMNIQPSQSAQQYKYTYQQEKKPRQGELNGVSQSLPQSSNTLIQSLNPTTSPSSQSSSLSYSISSLAKQNPQFQTQAFLFNQNPIHKSLSFKQPFPQNNYLEGQQSAPLSPTFKSFSHQFNTKEQQTYKTPCSVENLNAPNLASPYQLPNNIFMRSQQKIEKIDPLIPNQNNLPLNNSSTNIIIPKEQFSLNPSSLQIIRSDYKYNNINFQGINQLRTNSDITLQLKADNHFNLPTSSLSYHHLFPSLIE